MQTFTLTSISEIVSGLVLADRLSADAVDPDTLESPYDELVRAKRAGKEDHEIYEMVGFGPVNSARASIEAIPPSEKELGKFIKILEDVSLRVQAGTKFQSIAKKLLRGEPVDYSSIASIMSHLDEGVREFTTMDKVKEKGDVWIKSYLPWMDKFIGGLPYYGLTLVGAPPGTGKTSFMAQQFIALIKQKKKVLFFSLEMTLDLIKMRMLQLDPTLTKEDFSYVIASDEVFSYTEVYATCARLVTQHPDIYCVGIDFADLMIPEDREESVEVAGKIYRMMAKLSKKIMRPIYLLTQLSGGYVGGVPRVNHIRFSRLAEAMAAVILLLYNPDQLWVDMGEDSKKPSKLPYIPGTAYVIVGKCRYGYKMGQMGAVALDWGKIKGWQGKGEWIPIAGE